MTDRGNRQSREIEKIAGRGIGMMPSYVYFADEQDSRESLLFGGFLVHREQLSLLDEAVARAKTDVGLPPHASIKASPPDTPSYAAQRGLSPERREVLRQAVLAILSRIDALCFFSMVWKYDPTVSPDAYKWAFDNVLQRLVITVQRHTRGLGGVWYPALDVVVDWFPNPSRCKEYFGKYHKAYHEGYDFSKRGGNKLPPLKDLSACPCLLVTSCEFSPALQVADYCVSAMGRLLRWSYKRSENADDIRRRVEPVVARLLRINDNVLGFGLVLPTKGQARDKVRRALVDLRLC